MEYIIHCVSLAAVCGLVVCVLLALLSMVLVATTGREHDSLALVAGGVGAASLLTILVCLAIEFSMAWSVHHPGF